MESISIGIDTGGTFTDGFFVRGDEIAMAKVETTPHDLAICLFECLRAGAERLGYKSLEDMLRFTEIIRFSTTIGTNQLIEKKGPKLGVVVTKGNEDLLYSSNGNNPVMGFLVDREMVWGVDESADGEGRVENSPASETVKSIVKGALLKGAREVIVSFSSSVSTPANERSVKSAIQEDFPLHYLGYVPVLLSSEVSSSSDMMKRTNTTVVNAYIHQGLGRDLYRVEDQLRNSGLTRPLLIGHSDGGVARVAKTRAIDTYNSGPAAGIYGSSFMSRAYGLDSVLTMDIGGTSTDIGTLVKGKVTYDDDSRISTIPVDLPLLKIETFGAGGGSIARVEDGHITVGPESAGSIPGPACYGLGSTDPTVTDAYVCLGLVDPDYFLGGRKKLMKDEAERAITEVLAKPLGIGLEEAATGVIEAMEKQIAGREKALLDAEGMDTSAVSLFAFGGAGGMHGCSVADMLGCRRVFTFHYNPVFCAFGLTTLEILHRYEMRAGISNPGKDRRSAVEKLNAIAEELAKRAIRDIRGEGFPRDVKPGFDVSLNIKTGKGNSRAVTFNRTMFDEKDINAILAKGDDGAKVTIETVTLRAKAPVRKFEQPDVRSGNSEPAPSGSRNACIRGKKVRLPVYRGETLLAGSTVTGPAIVEGEFTNTLVLEGWTYSIDGHLNGILERI